MSHSQMPKRGQAEYWILAVIAVIAILGLVFVFKGGVTGAGTVEQCEKNCENKRQPCEQQIRLFCESAAKDDCLNFVGQEKKKCVEKETKVCINAHTNDCEKIVQDCVKDCQGKPPPKDTGCGIPASCTGSTEITLEQEFEFDTVRGFVQTNKCENDEHCKTLCSIELFIDAFKQQVVNSLQQDCNKGNFDSHCDSAEVVSGSCKIYEETTVCRCKFQGSCVRCERKPCGKILFLEKKCALNNAADACTCQVDD